MCVSLTLYCTQISVINMHITMYHVYSQKFLPFYHFCHFVFDSVCSCGRGHIRGWVCGRGRDHACGHSDSQM